MLELVDELKAVRLELGKVLNRLDTLDRHARTERKRAWWHRGVSAAIVVLVIGLGLVAWEQHRSRSESCEAIREAFDVYTDALAGFSSDGSDRTPEQQDQFDQRVVVFRAEIQTRLAACK